MVRREHAPHGRSCWVSTEPAPSFSELADSAAFHAEIVRQWPDLGSSVEAAGHAVFTIRSDSAGEVSWIDVLSSNLPDTALAFVSNLFAGRVKPLTSDTEDGPRPEGWTFRIGLDMHRSLAFNVSRPVLCTPGVRDQEQVAARLNALINSYGLDLNGPRRTTLLWILPGEDGRPRRMQVRRSSGSAELDQVAQHAVADALFYPAIADGHPVEVWIAIPINFAPRP